MINKKDAITLMFAGALFPVCIWFASEHRYMDCLLCLGVFITLAGLGMSLIGPPKSIDPRKTAIDKEPQDMGNVSDGYHTFNELYEHRMALFSAIVSAYPERSWKSRKHFDDEKDPMFDGYFVVGVETPAGEATYHYKLDAWDMFNCKEVPMAPKWDGHSPSDVVQRILTLRKNV